MPLDPSISLQAGQGARPLDPMGAFQQALTLRALSDQSQAQQLALQQQQRAMQRQEGVGKAYAVGPDGQIDRATTLRNLASGGYGPEAAQFSHQSTLDRLASEKAQRESEKAQFESVGKRVELRGRVMGALRDDASYLDAIRAAQFLNENGDQIDITQISQDPAQRARQIQQFRMHASTEFENYRKQFGPQTDTAKAFIDMGNATPEQLPVYQNIIAATGGKPDDLVRFENGQPVPNETAIRARERVGKAGAPQTKVDVSVGQEKEEAKAVGKAMGETYISLQQSARDARNKVAKLDRMNQLLEGVDTGRLTPLGTELAAYAQSLGIKVDPKLGNKEAAQALANEFALMLRNPSGGAGMPGAMSDADRNFLRSMSPGTEKTPQGRKFITESYKKVAQRDEEVAKLAREYRRKHGMLDEGFEDELAKFSAANPLFPTKQQIDAELAKRKGAK